MSLGKNGFGRLLAVPLALSLTFGSLFAGGGAAGAATYAPADADAAFKAWNSTFWDGGAKMFWKTTNRDNHMDFWIEAELWELVMDAYQHTSDSALKAQLRTQIDDVYQGIVAQYGADWTNNPFNDDIMWWAMASARAYQITGDSNYLAQAKRHFDFVYDTQWDDTFAGGGIWWLNSEHSTKNACINFPAAEAAMYLYNITKDTHYLDAAVRIFRWSKTMLTDGNGKVFDRIETANGPIPDATHYNQGTFIGAAVKLYQATGSAVYLDDAVKAASFTMTKLVDASGLLNYEGPNHDLEGGKTILLRNLGFLQQALAETGGKYAEFSAGFDAWAARNAVTAWSNRNANGLVDGNWAGQLLSGTYKAWSSAAAVEALYSIRPQEAEPQYVTKDAYARNEAERYNIGAGFIMEGSPEGTLQLGGIQPGQYAAYKNVDFGSTGAIGMIARASSGTGGGLIEVHLDSLDGPKAGTIRVEGTGSWNNFVDAVGLLKDDQGRQVTITGKHDVYLVFSKVNDQYLFNLNWFTFTSSDPTKTDAYAKLKAGSYDQADGLSRNAGSGYLDAIHNNAYAAYKGMDFGSGAAGVSAHVSSGAQGGTIEIHLDGLNGPLAGTIEVPALGDWNKWVDLTATIDDTKAVGKHDVYLVFRGKNGSDYPCNLDWFTFSSIKGKAIAAGGKIEAESSTGGSGFGRENGGGATYLAGIYGPNNPYAIYNYIDFGTASPKTLTVRAASDTSGGTIEARLDGMNGPVIASVPVTGTGGWQSFKQFQGPLTAEVTGKHIVYLLFKGSDYLFNLDKFTFGDPTVLDQTDPPKEPVNDGIPPGEVENVQVVRGDGTLTLYWDGPYDMDGNKVQLTLLQEGQPVGSTLEVGRGVQKAAFTGVSAGRYDIFIRTVDRWGEASKGVTVPVNGLPGYAFEADGEQLNDGATIEDSASLVFRATASGSAVASAALSIDGVTYTADPQRGFTVTLDMAGRLGAHTATVTVKDEAGGKSTGIFHFQVVTGVESMNRLIERYARSGELGGPLVPQLTNALGQAQHQMDKGHAAQAAKHMQDFKEHLNNPAMGRNVSDAAKAVLKTDAEALIADWESD